MIITISGKPGSGKSTVGKLLAKKLKYTHFSTGDFMREMAASRGVTILEINKLAKKDRTIDEELDSRQTILGKEDDAFVLDARLGFHFIPHSFKVFLDVDIDAAAERVANDTQSSRGVEGASTKADAKRQMLLRMSAEKARYKKLYRIDPYVLSNYDLVIDTTKIPAESVVEDILRALPAKKRK